MYFSSELQLSVINLIKEKMKWCNSIVIKKIESDFEYDNFIELQKEIKKSVDVLKKEKEKVYRPVKDLLDGINDKFSEPINVLNGVEKQLKRAAEEWYTKREIERKKEIKLSMKSNGEYAAVNAIPLENKGTKELCYSDKKELIVTDIYKMLVSLIDFLKESPDGLMKVISYKDNDIIKILDMGVKLDGVKVKITKVQRLSV